MVLTFSNLSEQQTDLQEELVKLKAYNITSAKVPMTRKLVEFEIDRIQTLLSGMEIEEIHKDDDDGILMMNQVCAEFDLQDSNSVEQLCEMLMAEQKIITRRFHRSLPRIISLILNVVNYLKQEISRKFMATASSVPKPASKVEMYINEAIGTAMKLNPQDFNVDRVIEVLRVIAQEVRVDHEDVRKLIFQKYAEAIESGPFGDRKTDQDDDDDDEE